MYLTGKCIVNTMIPGILWIGNITIMVNLIGVTGPKNGQNLRHHGKLEENREVIAMKSNDCIICLHYRTPECKEPCISCQCHSVSCEHHKQGGCMLPSGCIYGPDELNEEIEEKCQNEIFN
jgi:hypothetical protein